MLIVLCDDETSVSWMLLYHVKVVEEREPGKDGEDGGERWRRVEDNNEKDGEDDKFVREDGMEMR